MIAFDLVCTSKNSGSLTYIVSLLQGLKKNPPKNKMYIFMTKKMLHSQSKLLNKCKNLIIIKVPEFYTLSYFRIIWIQILLPIKLKKFKIQKLLSPLNICPIINKYFKIKTTLVIHSNLPWTKFKLMPGSDFKKKLIKYFMEKSLKSCENIICVSRSSKKELSKILKSNISNKIKHLSLSINEEFYKTKNSYYLKAIDYKKHYILTISSCAKYHNIINLIRSFNNLKSKLDFKIKYYLLLTVLDKKYFDQINSYIKENNLDYSVKIITNVSPRYLFNLYKHAKAYVFSSYSESFGYTSLESMKMNCPVAISNHFSSREINGNAALYFNPNNINDISDKLHKIIIKKKIIKKLKKNGNNQVKKYHPGKHLQGLLKIINEQ